MNPQRWEEIQSTFDIIVEMDDVGRVRKLAALNTSDPELRAAVELLLAADSDADARLASLDAVFFPQAVPAIDPLGLEGRTVAHFNVHETIGTGGMGVVYRADDVRLGREVALKFLLPSYSLDSNAKARFMREAHLIAALDHPNLCTIYEVGTSEDGRFFLAMALYQGETLKARTVREGPMRVSDVLEITTQIAKGLQRAHEVGIVHRDLKPGNVMLLKDGTVKILDFGLAKARDQSLSETGDRFGTVSYMSPEQIRGDAADGRSDLWSLGVVVYEMLAARKPFGREQDIAIAHAILHDEPEPLSTHRRDVTPALEDMVFRLLHKDPARRYPTTSELLTELAQIDTTVRQGAIASLRARWRRGSRAAYAKRKPILATFGAMLVTAGTVSFGRSREITIDPNTVVVGEFENRTGDSTLARIGASLSDWTTQGLQGTRAQSVVPTPAALQASRFAKSQAVGANPGNPLAVIADETGAGVIVSGAYYRSGDSLTFHTQLSSATAGFWQRLFHSGIRIRLQSSLAPLVVHRDSAQSAIKEIRSRVMAALSLSRGEEFSAPQLERAPPTYEAYLHFNEGMDAYLANDHKAASEAFLKAYRKDTTFVVSLLYSALAKSNMQQYAGEDSLLRIVARSADSLSTYHRLWLEYRQALLAQDRPKALRAVRALSAAAPRSKATYNLAIEAWEDGHLEEAVEALKSLPPEVGPVRDFLPYWGALATTQHLLGNYNEALNVSRRARAAHPDLLWPIGWELGAMAALGQVDAVVERARTIADAPRDEMGSSASDALREAAEELRAHGHAREADVVWNLALRGYQSDNAAGTLQARDRFGWASSLYALKRYDDAERVIRVLLTAQPGEVRALGQMGTIAARRGDSASAAAILDSLASMNRPYQWGRPAYFAALIAATLGNNPRALQLLRRGMAEGKPYAVWPHREIDLESIRPTPAFQTLVRPVPLKPKA
ncbi:MAG: protein kinase [Gemmatimonadales bacterium]